MTVLVHPVWPSVTQTVPDGTDVSAFLAAGWSQQVQAPQPVAQPFQQPFQQPQPVEQQPPANTFQAQPAPVAQPAPDANGVVTA